MADEAKGVPPQAICYSYGGKDEELTVNSWEPQKGLGQVMLKSAATIHKSLPLSNAFIYIRPEQVARGTGEKNAEISGVSVCSCLL